MQRIVDWPARMKEVADFVGLDQAELDVIESTRNLVLAKGEEMGRFYLGSTIVLLLPENSLRWDESSQANNSVRLGKMIASTS